MYIYNQKPYLPWKVNLFLLLFAVTNNAQESLLNVDDFSLSNRIESLYNAMIIKGTPVNIQVKIDVVTKPELMSRRWRNVDSTFIKRYTMNRIIQEDPKDLEKKKSLTLQPPPDNILNINNFGPIQR